MRYTLPRAILLDLDDTIIANEVYKDECWNIVGSEFSGEVENMNEVIKIIKQTSNWFWSDPERHRKWRQDLTTSRKRICSIAFSRAGIPDDGLSSRIADRFSALRESYIKPFPGAIDAINFLREKEVRLSLVTNGSSSSQRGKIERFGLSQLFDYIFVEGEHDFGKPDPRSYEYALKKLNVGPSDSWMIGDKFEWEIEAPGKLGIKGIWINSRKEVVENSDIKPFFVLNSLSDIMELVD